MNVTTLPRRLAALVTAGVTTLALASCGEAASTNGPAEITSDEAKTAQDAVAASTEAFTEVGDLGTPVDTSSLSGKKVFYVPLAVRLEYFSLVRKNLEKALGEVGVELHLCDGEATPTAVSNCLAQAKAQGADAIITDYVPYILAATAFKQVQEAGIPTYLASATIPKDVTLSEKIAVGNVLVQDAPVMDSLVDMVIADSDAKAHVLFIQNPDTESSAGDAKRARDHFEEACPDCTVTTLNVSIPTITQLPSQVSSALLKDPSITHVAPQYDTFLAATLEGIQSAGKASQVRLSTASANLATVQEVKNGDRLLGVSGSNPAYIAWTMADAVLRMLTGEQPPESYPNLSRTFTKDNVGDLELTPEGAASGDWYGDVSLYQDTFLELWGAE